MSESMWPVIQEAFQAIGPHYQEQTRVLMEELGYEQGDWFVSFLGYSLHPQPLTAVALQKKYFCYSSIQRVQELLAGAADRGFLQKAEDDQYTLAAKGRTGMERFFAEAWRKVGILTPLPEWELNRVADLLHRVVAATMAAPQPTLKANLKVSRHTDPGLDAPSIVRIDQYLTDLLRYRDDAHIAAWQSQGTQGYAWEAFTYLWRGEATTVAELVEKLPPRGYEAAGYTGALQALVQRGWLHEADGAHQLTEAGKTVRDEAEAQTEENFAVGLWALDEAEIEELKSLLRRLKEGLALEPQLETA